MYKIIHNSMGVFINGIRKLCTPLSKKVVHIFRLVRITLKKT